MATGGYKLVSFSWQGGRTDTALDRCKFILHGFCSAIVNANAGWVWDTSWIEGGSIDNYKRMGGHTESSPNIAYVLKTTVNSVVYRAIIGLNYYNMCGLREQDCVVTYNNTTPGYRFPGSLYVGMQKGGELEYDETYGLIPKESNPGQFLRWMAFASFMNSSGNSFAGRNLSDVLYTYYAVIKGSQLAFFAKVSAWNSEYMGNCLKGFICGEIFKNTDHATDTNTFGSVYLCGLGKNNEYGQFDSSGSSILSNTPRNVRGGIKFVYDDSSSYYYWNNNFSQIFKANGDLLSGYNTLTQEHVQLMYDVSQVDNNTCNTVLSPGGRWTPCYVYYATLDQITNGVVPGDSFKGHIDTDLLRGVNPLTPYGQLLGTNSDFCHIGGGFAIGWDSTNDSTMF